MARNCGFENIPAGDQRVEDDYIDELIRKYLNSEDMNSFYEDTSVPLLTSPEADKWPGEVLPPDFMNYNQDFSVPELFLLEDIDSLPEKFDDVGSEEDLLSILDEIITEDEKKTEENVAVSGEVAHVQSNPKPEQVMNNTDSTAVNQETTSQKRKRTKRTLTDKKVKPAACRRPIIIKSRAKRRNVEE